MRLQHVSGHMLQNPRVLSNGAQPNAMYGKLKAAVTIQFVEKKVKVTKGHVGGLTTSQVIGNRFP